MPKLRRWRAPNLLIIALRELHSYFVSPIAYVVITVFLAVTGFIFYGNLAFFLRYALQSSLQAQFMGGLPPVVNVNEFVIRPFFDFLSFLFLFLVPILTMGLLAEEKKRGTDELLLTSPLTSWQLVGGKFLAAFLFLLGLILLSLIYMALLFLSGRPDPGPVLSGYVGAILLGAGLLALGLFISALTENQIIAVVSSYGLFLILLLIGFFSSQVGPTLGAVLSYLSILEHYDDFAKGVVDLSGLSFFLSLAGFGLLLTFRTIDSLRWRQ